MSDEFKLLGHGFDTIQFSFQTRIPDWLSDAVASAQMLAKESRKPEPVEPRESPHAYHRHFSRDCGCTTMTSWVSLTPFGRHTKPLLLAPRHIERGLQTDHRVSV